MTLSRKSCGLCIRTYTKVLIFNSNNNIYYCEDCYKYIKKMIDYNDTMYYERDIRFDRCFFCNTISFNSNNELIETINNGLQCFCKKCADSINISHITYINFKESTENCCSCINCLPTYNWKNNIRYWQSECTICDKKIILRPKFYNKIKNPQQYNCEKCNNEGNFFNKCIKLDDDNYIVLCYKCNKEYYEKKMT
jgi:hypothetical protein